MKLILPFLELGAFVFGIMMILKADTGLFGSYMPSLIAGVILCMFAGSYLWICLNGMYHHHQSKA